MARPRCTEDVRNPRGRPSTKFRWTLKDAEKEFQVSLDWLLGKLKAEGIYPSKEDFKYSTQQICAVVYSNAQQEKFRKMKADADNAEIKREKALKQFIRSEPAIRFCQGLALMVREYIRGAQLLPDATKELILDELEEMVNPEKLVSQIIPDVDKEEYGYPDNQIPDEEEEEIQEKPELTIDDF